MSTTSPTAKTQEWVNISELIAQRPCAKSISADDLANKTSSETHGGAIQHQDP